MILVSIRKIKLLAGWFHLTVAGRSLAGGYSALI